MTVQLIKWELQLDCDNEINYLYIVYIYTYIHIYIHIYRYTHILLKYLSKYWLYLKNKKIKSGEKLVFTYFNSMMVSIISLIKLQ